MQRRRRAVSHYRWNSEGRVVHGAPTELRWRSLMCESLEERLPLACGDGVPLCDFGDAPALYPTLLADDGPRHEDVGPRLGSSRDVEEDGQPSADAMADELGDLTPDGTGVTFSSLILGDQNATATVVVTGASGAVKLDAWIDFDGDGSWLGWFEQIASSHSVVNGENQLVFEIPATAVVRQTYARFRLSTAGGLSPIGPSADGEVEDYRVTIMPAEATAEWRQHSYGIGDGNSLVECCSVRSPTIVDLDRDGDSDIVYGRSSSTLSWLENNGEQEFIRHTIAELAGPLDIEVVDFDRDRDLDIVSVSRTFGRLEWFENDGSQHFTSHIIGTALRIGLGLVVSDIDIDGEPDIVVAVNTGELVLFRSANQRDFTRTVLASGLGIFNDEHTVPVQAADFDADGDVDIFVNAKSPTGELAVFRNNGQFVFEPATLLTTNLRITGAHLTDFDRDGDYDLVAHTGRSQMWPIRQRLSWWENRNGFFDREHVVSENIDADFVFVATTVDADGDGDNDIISASDDFSSPPTCLHRMFRNTGDNTTFSDEVFATTLNCGGDFVTYPFALAVGDIDSDGDVDVIGNVIVQYTPQPRQFLTWHENKDNWVALVSDGTSHVLENSATSIEIRITRRGSTSKAISVEFEATATALSHVGFDILDADRFADGVGELLFPVGVSERSLRLKVLDNSHVDDHMRITLRLRDGVGHIATENSTYTLFVVDDEPSDYGDAPTRYYTSALREGARHGLSGPTLGSRRDAELDGEPSDDARSDDRRDGASDEDGVVISPLRVGQTDAFVRVAVRNAPHGARLSAWIDFDQDGSWGSADEMIANNLVVLGDSDVTVRFDVPTRASSGTTYARFRVSTRAIEIPHGFMADGEVEDYQITLRPPLASLEFGPPAFVFPAGTIENVPMPATDLDRDGDLDLVGAVGRTIVWYENNGSGLFSPSVIVDSTIWYQYRVTELLALDWDSDGDDDILIASSDIYGVWWIENLGSRQFAAKLLTDFGVSMLAIRTADLDRDGDQDLFVRYNDVSSRILYFLRDRMDGLSWRAFGNTPYHDDFSILEVTDVDSDGNMDVVSQSSRSPNAMSWYQHLGNGQFQENPIWTGFFAEWGAIADFNGDRRPDILLASTTSSDFVVLENQGAGQFQPHAFPVSSVAPHDITVVDWDGDGDPDLVMRSSPVGQWYENRWSSVPSFARHDLGIAMAEYANVTVGDFNGDGRFDLVVSDSDESSRVFLANPLGDFNTDGVLDLNDIDRLVTEVVNGSTNPKFDLNYDSLVNQADVNFWIERIYGTVLGDANLDYVVDASDFNVFNAHKFSPSGRWSMADFTADGVTDISDFNVWHVTRFSSSHVRIAAASQAIPAVRRVPRVPAVVSDRFEVAVDAAFAAIEPEDKSQIQSVRGDLRLRTMALATRQRRR